MLKLLLVLLAAALVVGCSSPPPADKMAIPPPVDVGDKSFAGVYKQQGDQYDGGLYRLEVHPDGRFAIANLSSVFFGTWEEKDGKVSLTIIEGSSGKLSTPRNIFVSFGGGDSVSLGEEWGGTPLLRVSGGPQYLISFAGTSLNKK